MSRESGALVGRLQCAARRPMMGGVTRMIRCAGRPMTAVVLAGGRGLRMKADKAGLDVGGRTLLAHVLAQLEPLFDEVVVTVSPGGTRRAAAAAGTGPRGGRRTGPRIVEDGAPGLGPLGGLLAGLKAAVNEACAVVACDIPDVDAALLRSLARAAARAEIAVPVDPEGRREPLFAVYRKSAVPAVEALLRSGERSVLPLFDKCRTAAVGLGGSRRLRNLNTPADYAKYLSELSGRGPARP